MNRKRSYDDEPKLSIPKRFLKRFQNEYMKITPFPSTNMDYTLIKDQTPSDTFTDLTPIKITTDQSPNTFQSNITFVSDLTPINFYSEKTFPVSQYSLAPIITNSMQVPAELTPSKNLTDQIPKTIKSKSPNNSKTDSNPTILRSSRRKINPPKKYLTDQASNESCPNLAISSSALKPTPRKSHKNPKTCKPCKLLKSTLNLTDQIPGTSTAAESNSIKTKKGSKPIKPRSKPKQITSQLGQKPIKSRSGLKPSTSRRGQKPIKEKSSRRGRKPIKQKSSKLASSDQNTGLKSDLEWAISVTLNELPKESSYSMQFLRTIRKKYPKNAEKILYAFIVFKKVKYMVQWKTEKGEKENGDVVDAEVVVLLWPDTVKQFLQIANNKNIISLT